MRVRSISLTQPCHRAVPGFSENATPEALMVYTARVSAPQNQTKHETGAGLLRYCIRHGHWSVFELVDWTVEIETSRAIAAQILRHRSFSFQEFSQRYAEVDQLGDNPFEPVEIRLKNPAGNRQGSVVPDGPVEIPHAVYTADERTEHAIRNAFAAYRELLSAGVAPEVARMILPLATRTRLYMKGSVRSWIHYLQVRCDGHAQKEHRLVAEAVRGEFCHLFPIVAEALGWMGNPEVTAST